MSTVDEITRTRNKAGCAAWRELRTGLEISHKLDPSVPDWDDSLLDFFTWGRKITGVGYSGLLTRYADMRCVRLVEGCDLGNASFMVRNSPNSIERMNPVAKKAPVAVELLNWIHRNFAEADSTEGLQLRTTLMVVFFSSYAFLKLKTSTVRMTPPPQATDGGNALTVRIRKSKLIRKVADFTFIITDRGCIAPFVCVY